MLVGTLLVYQNPKTHKFRSVSSRSDNTGHPPPTRLEYCCESTNIPADMHVGVSRIKVYMYMYNTKLGQNNV